ncbi:MAG: asparaginase domain-containing protein [Ilumatobacteraceae bacterium]|nr:asparaginase domain-containing protein [Ilumatobacteraceae bacterium]
MTVHVIATGGTISSHYGGADWTSIAGAQLVAEAGPHPCEVVVEDIATGPSSNLTVDEMVRIAQRVRVLLDDGAQGVVVTHGTDTIELTAFVTALLLGVDATRQPVVFTGSMRVHSHADSDGSRNVRDAIAVAADPAAIGREVLVCLEGSLHAAEHVVKVNANSVDAFTSAPFAALGAMVNGTAVFHSDPALRPPATAVAAEVPLLTAYPGIDPSELSRLTHGVRAVVVEAFGDLNVPQQLWGPIHQAWNDGVLVVLASRSFTATRDGDGLALLGAVGAGGLTAQKARLAVMAALGTHTDRDAVIRFFHQFSLSYDALDRSTS